MRECFYRIETENVSFSVKQIQKSWKKVSKDPVDQNHNNQGQSMMTNEGKCLNICMTDRRLLAPVEKELTNEVKTDIQ